MQINSENLSLSQKLKFFEDVGIPFAQKRPQDFTENEELVERIEKHFRSQRINISEIRKFSEESGTKADSMRHK